ncbi:hypothetical protein AB9K41_20200, partial [Cribrihabitans sp. XS_ASV171]
MKQTTDPVTRRLPLKLFEPIHAEFLGNLDLSGYDWLKTEHLHFVDHAERDIVLPFAPREFVRFLVVAAVVAPHEVWMTYVEAAL